MVHDDVTSTLAYLYPGVEWSYSGDGSSLDGLAWYGDGAAPTLADLEAALPAVQAQEALATAADHRASSDAIITAKLAAVPIPRSDVTAILEQLLGEATAAIPFFETYALDPSMTSTQWTDFQALDQTTKDRLLYDVVRSMAALMRYLSGDLPLPS